MSMKNPLTPAGIEPATFRFVAQHLNHCATAQPPVQVIILVQQLQFLALLMMGAVTPETCTVTLE